MEQVQETFFFVVGRDFAALAFKVIKAGYGQGIL